MLKLLLLLAVLAMLGISWVALSLLAGLAFPDEVERERRRQAAEEQRAASRRCRARWEDRGSHHARH